MVTIGGERFLLARWPPIRTADSAAQERSAIPRHGGMLFPDPSPRPLAFVMRDCKVPIDVAFLDAGGRVLNVHTRRPSHRAGRTERRRLRVAPAELRERRPARYAMELAAGRFAELGIEPGDHIAVLPSPDSSGKNSQERGRVEASIFQPR